MKDCLKERESERENERGRTLRIPTIVRKLAGNCSGYFLVTHIAVPTGFLSKALFLPEWPKHHGSMVLEKFTHLSRDYVVAHSEKRSCRQAYCQHVTGIFRSWRSIRMICFDFAYAPCRLAGVCSIIFPVGFLLL